MNERFKIWKLGVVLAIGAGIVVAAWRGPLREGTAQADNNSTAGATHNDGVKYVLSQMPGWWRSGCICCCEPCPCDPGSNMWPLVLQAVQNYAAQGGQQAGPIVPPDGTSLDVTIDNLAAQGRFSPPAQGMLHQLAQVIQTNSSATLAQYNAQLDQLDAMAEQQLVGPDLATYQDASSVARSSGSMWALQANGGINGVGYLPNVPNPDPVAADIDWGHVVGEDVKGYLSGGIWTAIVASVVDIIKQIL
jgi:hypothetical protein